MIDKPGSFMDNGLQIFLRIEGVRSTKYGTILYQKQKGRMRKRNE